MMRHEERFYYMKELNMCFILNAICQSNKLIRVEKV